MQTGDARDLIADAVDGPGGTWADIGAGEGTFTLALAEVLGPGARIYAVDRDAGALSRLTRSAVGSPVEVIPVVADFTEALDLQRLEPGGLDGMLLANALHFAAEAGRVLARLSEAVRPGGRVVIVEYDRRRGSPWVPHPIPADAVGSLAAEAGLAEPTIVATRPSAYGGTLYVAASTTRLS